MKIDTDPRLPLVNPNEPQYNKELAYRLSKLFKDIAIQLNGISEGTQAAFYASLSSAPTSGTWAKGDFVLNSGPAELGSTGSKYIVHGWRCVAGGTPGTWLQCRFLTGN